MAYSESTTPRFPATRWTLIEQLRQGNEAAAFRALENLLEMYYQPLRAFVVWRFHVGEEQAAEWLHSFVWKKVIIQQCLAKVNHANGKFRTFVAAALVNFVIDEIRGDGRHFRQPQGGLLPLDEALDLEDKQVLAQCDHFNRSWGQAILAETCRRMKQECQQKALPKVWAVFEIRLLEPILNGGQPLPYNELYARLRFKSEVEAGNALTTAKRMFSRIIRTVIREYARDEAEVETEIQELMRAFRQG